MKKQLLQNTLVTIAALFIAIIALPTTAQAQDYVDLGLPSGTKWATKNLGASKPSDYGDYYAWGETEPKTEYTWATYKWMQTGQSDWKHITKYTFADGMTETSATATVSAIYSLDGSRQPQMQRGVNIVKMSDGTTRKVIRR